MSDGIHVHVIDRGRKNLYLRFVDPLDGKAFERSSGTSRRRDAERLAAKWEAELREGRSRPAGRITWSEFRQRYEDEHLTSLSAQTDRSVCGTFNVAENHLPILRSGRLATLDEARISTLQKSLRTDGLSEATIAKHMRHLRAALNWAKRQGLIERVPHIEKPRRAKRSDKQTPMKGRSLLGEEFERMILAVPHVVLNQARGKLDEDKWKPAERRRVESWRCLLNGLWWSGLRLGEALDLWWDRDDRLRVDYSIDPRFPMLQIPSELEKGNKDRLMPIAPEFDEFLRSTPVDDRRGRIFRPHTRRGEDRQLTSLHVGKVISDIGCKANVRVSERGKVKFASAQDLRRSFGWRWASRVMPPVLQQLMRHESIETTLRYYVGRDAARTSALLWQAVQPESDSLRDTSADSPESSHSSDVQASLDEGLAKHAREDSNLRPAD